jgi:hypothetical protein
MVWLDRAGLTLEFLAFLFAAPELLGNERLLRLHKALSRGVSLLLILPVALGLMLLAAAASFRLVDITSGSFRLSLLVSGGMLCVLSALYLLGGRKLLTRLAAQLRDQESLRRNFLVIGAACYGFGFLCQFAATFR